MPAGNVEVKANYELTELGQAIADKDAALVSKLFKSMLGKEIMIVEKKGNNNIYYGRKK